MKKKVMICLISIFTILLIFVVTVILLYHSEWAGEINYNKISTCSPTWELDYDKQKYAYTVRYVFKDDIFEVEHEVKELNGIVNVVIYGEQDLEELKDYSGAVTCGGDIRQNDDFSKTINPEHEIMRYQLTKVGTEKYSISEKYNYYIVTMELVEGSEYAKINETTYAWSTNWDCLLCKLGIKGGRGKNGVGTMRQSLE